MFCSIKYESTKNFPCGEGAYLKHFHTGNYFWKRLSVIWGKVKEALWK